MSRRLVPKFFLFTLASLFISAETPCLSAVMADPDHISTGIGFTGTPSVRVGDALTGSIFSGGGMIEVRNEERFNQGLLPNHNWRGFAFVYADYVFPAWQMGTTGITAGFEHESAHPTMGLNESASDEYEKVYDGTYRNINLNSFLLRVTHTVGSSFRVNLCADFQFYFLSRNTPELPWGNLGWSEGLSGGVEIFIPCSEGVECYLSVFDRYIFRGPVEERGYLWEDQGGVLVQVERDYPRMNSVNTVAVRAGVCFKGLVPCGTVSIYLGLLHGNIFGLTDSREVRTIYSAGIEFMRRGCF